MKYRLFALALVAGSMAAAAQTPAKPSTPTTHSTATTSSAVKLPPGIPVVHGIVRTAFSLRYEDYKIGTGPEAEPNKLYRVHYTGWLAADGHKFDSSYDHPGPPELDKDGKPVMDADGKPKHGAPQPMAFPQGMGRLIPGFDQGVAGMKIGGKRRNFIPWQLAYGAKGRPGPDPAHPGIPAKADLIFDVELVEVTDLPQAPMRPGMGMPGGRPMPRPQTPGEPGAPATPGATPPAGSSAAPATPSAPPSAPATPLQPSQPATPPATPPASTPATPPPAPQSR
jgi:peptidylprolyl isomerase